jgi:hypothetical protein
VRKKGIDFSTKQLTEPTLVPVRLLGSDAEPLALLERAALLAIKSQLTKEKARIAPGFCSDMKRIYQQ